MAAVVTQEICVRNNTTYLHKIIGANGSSYAVLGCGRGESADINMPVEQVSLFMTRACLHGSHAEWSGYFLSSRWARKRDAVASL